jgi:hypothetical protein
MIVLLGVKARAEKEWRVLLEGVFFDVRDSGYGL